ncbi:MAG: thiolase family protein [Candidatus Marinimicrobia bacterium]|jgi:acetyl-CoA C-acetyltransferase|nr:thiolase family protein [Candidatus Neomarinimicrobiota bacterium]MBT3633981.1 thiolase family protein [Candidatus Neomarinimicrobiota bacterium]MBT3683745.1 thiolase family protein [Candidatus Neomarinimicrobiota bacterium]MBT3760625.1 thiolase family protein [Candidatus Neomarinimicrobiota bacterium]MBT3895784.1 thiolase family protein [Candidatus Neomarinimicrobiota bacterium]
MTTSKIFGALYENIYLFNGARTPFGKFCGSLGSINPTDLGIIASKAALERSGVTPDQIDHVVFANIIQSGFDALYLPRHIALYCGIPQEVPALMVQRICGSGFESIITGVEQIVLGKANIVLSGGAENMTLAPTSAFGNRQGYRFGTMNFGDMLWEGLYDPAGGCSMGHTAENLAKKYHLTREEIDEYAFRSQSLAFQKMKDGTLGQEIVETSSGINEFGDLKPRKYRTSPFKVALTHDENIRESALEQLGQLRPTFGKDGVQTAGNSSGIVDGAAAVVIGNKDIADKNNIKPLARILGSASAGVDPKIMGIGPVPSIQNVLKLAGLSISDIDLFEINEAFGAQIVAVEKELGLDREKLNVNGGAIAIGHPLAATGTRLTHSLALEMKRRNVRYGIASACIGGGQGTAILLENN